MEELPLKIEIGADLIIKVVKHRGEHNGIIIIMFALKDAINSGSPTNSSRLQLAIGITESHVAAAAILPCCICHQCPSCNHQMAKICLKMVFEK